jgi:hypothetical protein
VGSDHARFLRGIALAGKRRRYPKASSIFGFYDILDERHVILDPSRVAAQVASGIGFS